MSDTDSNPEYPPLSLNLFDAHSVPVEFSEVNDPSTTPPNSLPPLPHPSTPVKMVDPSSSGKLSMFCFMGRVDKKTLVNVKLDSIGKLTR